MYCNPGWCLCPRIGEIGVDSGTFVAAPIWRQNAGHRGKLIQHIQHIGPVYSQVCWKARNHKRIFHQPAGKGSTPELLLYRINLACRQRQFNIFAPKGLCIVNSHFSRSFVPGLTLLVPKNNESAGCNWLLCLGNMIVTKTAVDVYLQFLVIFTELLLIIQPGINIMLAEVAAVPVNAV